MSLGKAASLAALILSVVMAIAGCGGSGQVNSGGGVSGGTAPAESVLWEISLTDSSLYAATIDTDTGTLGAPTTTGGDACNGSVTLSPIAVTPSNKYLVAIDSCIVGFEVFSITSSGSGFTLTEINGGQPFYFAAGAFDSLAILPNGRFMYTVEGLGKVDLFGLASDGTPTEVSQVATNADLRTVLVHPNGNFLYVNDLTGGRIFAYAVAGNGSLSPVPGSPFAIPAGGQPARLIMTQSGDFLYAPLIAGGIAGFAVNSSTGVLTSVPGSPFATPSGPSAVTIDPAGHFLYLTIGQTIGIHAFTINSSTGALNEVAGSPFSSPAVPTGVTVDSSGHYLYASMLTTMLANSVIAGYEINASTGSLSTLTGSPFPAAPFPWSVITLHTP